MTLTPRAVAIILSRSLRSLAPSALALGLAASLPACASSDASDPPPPSPVEQIDDEASLDDPADDDTLGPDPEPMATDDAIDAAADRPDAVQDDEADADLDLPQTTTATPRCKKRIHVAFAVYTYLPENLGGSGCWSAERTVQDPRYRDCHADGSVKHASGDRWFYDDTNPRNDLATERRVLHDCSAGRAGFEYMAFRDGRWRLITRPHALAYFAELYTDDAHIDDLYYVSGVYRQNAALHRHRRVAPMLNFAPFPDGRYSQRQIAREVLKVCKTVHNHGWLGLYEWHYPLGSSGAARLANLVHALDACTRR
jgi:hypothetical protein